MSMVTVHGPNTMYTGTPGTGGTSNVATSPGGQAKATTSPASGMTFAFEAVDKSRPVGDYGWTFSDTRPAQPGVRSGSVTFVTPGAQSITLTVTGSNPAPPALQNGTYTIPVTAAAGQPRMVEQSVGPDMSQPALKPEEIPNEGEEWDPGDYTVADVLAWAEDHPDEIPGILEAEIAGRNRITLVTQLEEMQE